MKLKYQDLINELNLQDCPDPGCQQIDTPAFRFGSKNVKDPANWQLQAIKLRNSGRFPRRNASNDRTCADCALSFFKDALNAKIVWNNMARSVKSKLGYTTIMGGKLIKTDGLCSRVSNTGHFNLFEFDKIDLSLKFTVVDSL